MNITGAAEPCLRAPRPARLEMLYKEVAFDPDELLPQKLLTSDNSEGRAPR